MWSVSPQPGSHGNGGQVLVNVQLNFHLLTRYLFAFVTCRGT